MKLILFTILFYSLNSFAFFGLFEEKRPDPMTLQTEEEQMEYLRKYLPESYERVIKYKQQLGALKIMNSEIDKDMEEWKNYEKYAADPVDIEKEKAEAFREKVRKKKEMEEKVKQMEKEILAKYKVVNGELVDKEKENTEERKKKEEALLRKRIIEFQKKNDLPVLGPKDRIDVKRE